MSYDPSQSRRLGKWAIAGVLSDLDGTLVDTKQANFESYRDALEGVGVAFSRSVFETTWGQDSRVFIPRIAPHLTAEEVVAVRHAKAQLYPNYFDRTRVNTPLIRMLESLRPTVKLGIVTTAKRRNATEILRHHRLEGLFDTLVCGEDCSESKPEPEPYLHALAALDLAATDCVALEDSLAGIESAKAAGLDVVVVRF